VTYVEAMSESTPMDLQEEAQEEARVFASLGDSIKIDLEI
jgi:signal transducing adaptor molecule